MERHTILQARDWLVKILFRQAIYVAIDVFRNRQREKVARANPLRKQYYEKRDDSDKLKLDTVDED